MLPHSYNTAAYQVTSAKPFCLWTVFDCRLVQGVTNDMVFHGHDFGYYCRI